MFITAVCFIFLIKLRWPKTKSLYDSGNLFLKKGMNPVLKQAIDILYKFSKKWSRAKGKFI